MSPSAGISMKDLIYTPQPLGYTQPELQLRYGKISYFTPPSFHVERRPGDNVQAIFNVKTGELLEVQRIEK